MSSTATVFGLLMTLAFILVKIAILHNILGAERRRLQAMVCPAGFYGPSPHPFECNSYFMCPDGVQLYCPAGQEFDVSECRAKVRGGCSDRLSIFN